MNLEFPDYLPEKSTLQFGNCVHRIVWDKIPDTIVLRFKRNLDFNVLYDILFSYLNHIEEYEEIY